MVLERLVVVNIIILLGVCCNVESLSNNNTDDGSSRLRPLLK
jgi:hypothetical protein